MCTSQKKLEQRRVESQFWGKNQGAEKSHKPEKIFWNVSYYINSDRKALCQ